VNRSAFRSRFGQVRSIEKNQRGPVQGQRERGGNHKGKEDELWKWTRIERVDGDRKGHSNANASQQ